MYTALKVGLAVGMLGYLLFLVNPSSLIALCLQADPAWLLAAVALWPLNLTLEALGWQGLVQPEVGTVRFRSSLASVLTGHALGLATPARAGELPGRALPLRHAHPGTLMAAVFTDRLIAMAAGLAAGLVAFAVYALTVPLGASAVWAAGGVCGGGVLLVLVGALLRPRPTYRLVRVLLPFRWLKRPLRHLLRLRSRRMAGLMALALLRCLLYGTMFVLLLQALVPGLAWGTAYMGVGTLYFVKFLVPPVTWMDLGIREGAAVFVLAPLGIPAATAFGAAFLLFCLNLVLPALVGLPLAWRLPLRRATSPAPPLPA